MMQSKYCKAGDTIAAVWLLDKYIEDQVLGSERSSISSPFSQGPRVNPVSKESPFENW